MKWLEEPVNLVGTFGSRFSGAVAVPIFQVCTCACLCEFVWVYTCTWDHKGLPVPQCPCVIHISLDLACVCVCVSLFHSLGDLWLSTSGFPGHGIVHWTNCIQGTYASVCVC